MTKTNLLESHPDIAQEWHPTKNNDLNPLDVTKGCIKKIWWLCKHGHEWSATANNRTSKNSKCPYCCGRLPSQQNNLAVQFPCLTKEWSPNNQIGPHEVMPGNRTKYLWICPKGHEYLASSANRTHGKGCPYCSGNLVCEDNCLATKFPHLIPEWHPKNKLNPNQVTCRSDKKVWWACKKGHEWQSQVKNRTYNDPRGCPYCAGKLPSDNYNLEVCFPELMPSWHPRNTNKPYQFTPKSGKKVWWLCDEGHEWLAVITSRTNRGSGCPVCRISRGELRIQEVLNKLKIKYKQHFTFPNCKYKRKLIFDFVIYHPNGRVIAIEYQGKQHYEPIEVFGGISALVSQQTRDQVKLNFCLHNSISLLQIPYTQYDNIDLLVSEFCK